MEAGIDVDQRIKTQLRRSDLFGLLADAEFEELLRSIHLTKLEMGDLLPQDESLQRMSILAGGRIRLLERFPGGEEIDVCTLEIFGECWEDHWLHIDGQGQVKARASEPSVILSTQNQVIQKLASNNAPFAEHLKDIRARWEIFRFLRVTIPFNSISAAKLRSIARYFSKSAFAPNTSLSNLSGLFVIERGAVECTSGAETRRLLCGEHFVSGEIGSIGSTGSKFHVVDSSELICLSQNAYMDLLNFAPDQAAMLTASIDPAESPAILAANALGQHFARPTPATKTTLPVSEVLPENETLSTKFNKLVHQYPLIMQQSQMDCGITCLAMVALYYGKRLDINDLRERAEVSVEGTSMLALAETAERFGFMSRGIRGTYEGLLSAKLPLICFWKENHFVVLYEINSHEARIGDPAEGLLTVSRADFTKDFSKSALELVPTVELRQAPGAKNPLLILWPLLKPYGPQIRDVLLVGVVFQALMIITPFFSQTIIDRVIVHEDVSMLNMLLVGMIIVSCFQSALTFARGILISTLSTKIDHALFVQFFRHLLSLPLKFFEQRSTGDILARFNENARITAFLSGGTITALLDVVMAVVYLAVLCYYSWAFALATLVYIALLIIAVRAYTPLLRGYSNELFKKTVINDSCVIESVQGIEKIKSAAAENRSRWKWEILFVDKLSVNFRQQLASNGYSQVTQFVHLVGRVLLMWLGANLVISKTFTVGQYMAANMMASMAVDPVMRMVSMWQQLQSVNISLERLGDVFRANPEQAGQKARLQEVQGFIEFRNVTFRYSEHAGKNTLLNVSLKIQPNQMVAIVGRSGCGKTTVARLIQGLYLPISGSVLVDGADISQIELADLRKRIGVVAQQEFFFTGTIRENIAFYLPDAPINKIITAAKIAGIHEKIKSMGSGYETLLTEGGLNLSGGERQRLAIARALLHNPRILIFDEATSALDSESERHVQASMEQLRKGRTLIVIAHRLSTIKSADIIIVMDQGQIVEAGTHQSLLEKKGLYYQLCLHQSL